MGHSNRSGEGQLGGGSGRSNAEERRAEAAVLTEAVAEPGSTAELLGYVGQFVPSFCPSLSRVSVI